MDFDNPISPERQSSGLSTKIIDVMPDTGINVMAENSGRKLTINEEARKIKERNGRFWNMLVSASKKVGYVPPEGRQTTVLDLACGRCEEGKVLNAFFGGKEFCSESDNVRLIGIDISKDGISRAVQQHSRLDGSQPISRSVLPPNYDFIHGDATNLDKYPQIPSQADVVVIRHEKISDDKDVWTKILQQGVSRVTPEGIVLVTSYSDVEHQMAIQALRELDCDIVLNEQNMLTRQLGDQKEIAPDRHLAVVKKGKQA